ncbi:NmrA/HSCARG family protein [Nocardia sp. CDC160]|uniref:NmrA/HSCARG family protein n=1 Tax=Nocardia sp. CDC160 TaxID=3112166 RepID=UPI002DBB1C7D|nr:NmrA/HSCARG family protein [Nocardia sp. CDC160]MEC3920254.1 NmrA/HSCARG family protein [Nocardia sp. CDC160]
MKTIVVTGATGHQGGAVVDALLASGTPWRVRALTRKADSAAAKALAVRGVEPVEADLDRPETLTPALEGAYGVFGVQQRGKKETARGVSLIDAAVQAGVEHFVYSSVGGVERVRGIPHFDSKWEVEKHLRQSGLPATVLRPSSYMEGFTMPGAATMGMSMMSATLGDSKTLQMIAVRDIGIFAALAFASPATYIGETLELAGDELTVPQMARFTGKKYWRRMPQWLLRAMGPESRMFFWFGESGYQADIADLRRRHPGLLTFEQWFTQQAKG